MTHQISRRMFVGACAGLCVSAVEASANNQRLISDVERLLKHLDQQALEAEDEQYFNPALLPPADCAPAVVKVLASPHASDAVRQRLFDSMAAIPAATYRDALVCFTNPLERFDFARLTMPVLMMTGEHDRLAPPSEIRSVAGRIWDAAPRPDVRFEVIAGAGHVCNVERPEDYSRILMQFLGRLP